MVDNKVSEMQYKILHRIIGTKYLLYKMRKVPNMTCEFCNMYIESIEHLFFYCYVVKNFWFEIMQRYSTYIRY